MERITYCFVLLCFVLNVECSLSHGQTNATSTFSGQSKNDVDGQIHHLQTALDSVLMDVMSLKQENQQMKNQQAFLLQQNTILEEKLNSLNASCTLFQQNVTTTEDIRRLEDALTFEMEQKIRGIERKLMMNTSAAIKDLQRQDHYLSLSLFDAHNNTDTLKHSLEEQQKLTKYEVQNSSLVLHREIVKLTDSLSKLQST
jgi:chromosome segregation ATPase